MKTETVAKVHIDCRMVTQDGLEKEGRLRAKCFFCNRTEVPYFIEAHQIEGVTMDICYGCAEDIGNAMMFNTELGEAMKVQGSNPKH
jgi:hypothetical protein